MEVKMVTFVSIFTIASIGVVSLLAILVITIIIALLFDQLDFVASRSFGQIFLWTTLITFLLAIVQVIFSIIPN